VSKLEFDYGFPTQNLVLGFAVHIFNNRMNVFSGIFAKSKFVGRKQVEVQMKRRDRFTIL
jgi:hypothetical protein